MNLAGRLLDIDLELVADHPEFYRIEEPGTSDLATDAFMGDFRLRAWQELGDD